jgi:dTDP-4-dehydrorhamnose reductase
VRDERPDAIVNCAAWTDVDGAQGREDAATAVNGGGAGHLAAAAAAAGAFIVHVSSDYVFDGRAPGGYQEEAPAAPLSAYGRSKLAGGRAVAKAALGDHAIVRSSWLFGGHGPNFVNTMLRLAGEREEPSVVEDQVGCPTFTGHLAGGLVTIAERRRAGVLHVAGEGSCSWFELARVALAQAGMDTLVLPCGTADFPRSAPRPACSVLRSTRADAPGLPPWRDGVREYLRERLEVTL